MNTDLPRGLRTIRQLVVALHELPGAGEVRIPSHVELGGAEEFEGLVVGTRVVDDEVRVAGELPHVAAAGVRAEGLGRHVLERELDVLHRYGHSGGAIPVSELNPTGSAYPPDFGVRSTQHYPCLRCSPIT